MWVDMKKRNEIEEKYKWDLSGYCTDLDSAISRIKSLVPEFEKLTKYENKLGNDELLFECLETNRKFGEKFEVLARFCSLKQKEDATVSKTNEILNVIESISSDLGVKLSFIDVEISKFSNARLNNLIANPKFVEYKEMFEDVKRHKKHTLSKSQEKLLSRVGEFAGGFSDVFDMFDSCDVVFDDAIDSDGKKYALNNANYSQFVRDKDEKLRLSAYSNMMGAYGKLNKTLAANYLSSVKADCAYAKMRKYGSALDKALYNEEISTNVYEKLIEKVHSNLKDFYEYFEEKRKMLGLKNFKICDAYAENPNVPKFEFTFEEAFEVVKTALKPLGEDYKKLLDKAKQERWVDVYPNVGKDTGAFSSGAYRKNPIVLMNFVGDINSVFTLAHELGHSMHTYLADHAQNSINSGYPIFLAEIASTTNEMLLLDFFMKNAKTNDEKIYFVDTYLNMARATIFRQTMFAEFEQIIHENYEKMLPLSADVLNQTYFDLNRLYFGDNVEILDCAKYEWSRIPHFYNDFYVYKYATGLISAIAISQNILKDNSYSKQYLKMLSMGGKLPPLKTLEICGIDMTKDTPFDNAFSSIKEKIRELKELQGEK